jgi:hypothetical protein
MAIEALHSGLDVVEVLWRATVEAGRLRGVVDTGARRHGGQAQGGAQMNAMQDHLVDAAYHRAKATSGMSPGAFTLFPSFSASAFSPLSSASRSAGVTEQRQLVLFKIKLKLNKLQDSPSMASSNCLR